MLIIYIYIYLCIYMHSLFHSFSYSAVLFFLVKRKGGVLIRMYLKQILSFFFDHGTDLRFVQENTTSKFFGRMSISDSTKVKNLVKMG
jgi:hypothetical protein